MVNALTSFLRSSRYAGTVNEYDGDNILDVVVINDASKLVSDYWTLSLIYEDLKQTNSNYESKYFFYDQKCKELLSQCLSLLDLDLNEDDETDVHGAEISYYVKIRK